MKCLLKSVDSSWLIAEQNNTHTHLQNSYWLKTTQKMMVFLDVWRWFRLPIGSTYGIFTYIYHKNQLTCRQMYHFHGSVMGYSKCSDVPDVLCLSNVQSCAGKTGTDDESLLTRFVGFDGTQGEERQLSSARSMLVGFKWWNISKPTLCFNIYIYINLWQGLSMFFFFNRGS